MARPRFTFTTQQHQPESLFEVPGGTPAIGRPAYLSETVINSDLLTGWNALRDTGIKPLNCSDLAESEEGRAEFLTGAVALGLIGRNKELKPQQLLIADVCNAAHQTIGALIPRRSSKTTSLFALALGRCFEREGYLVGYTACTTGQKARDRFKKDIAPVLERIFPDKDSRPFKIVYSGGLERIVFDNGSIFQVLPPIGEAFRSDSFDMVILDEAGEASPEMTDDLIQGIMPTFDTRPGAQLIVAGTAAKFRDGNLLWNTLVDGRHQLNDTAILEFAAPDSTTDEELDDWETVKKLVLAAHPGVGTLTTLEVVHARWMKLKRQQFAEEYLSIFGLAGATTGIVSMEGWNKGRNKGALPRPPARFSMAIAVHPDQISACIVAAWRVRGKPRILVLEHRRGNLDWLTKRARELASKYRTPIVHDTNGPVTVEAEALGRMRPKPKLLGQSFPNVKTAAALIIKEIEAGRLEHYDQEPLNEAARLAKKRSVGPTAWALGRQRSEDDIITLEAAAMALRVYDETVTVAGRTPIMAA